MRVLAITRIFPNSLEPLSSPFNRQQFGALAKHVDLDVLEAIPYVPLASRFGVPARAAKLDALPKDESIDGIPVRIMRAPYLPRVGLAAAAPLYFAASLLHLDLVRRADIILGAWAYPDAAVAIALARLLGKPSVIKVHGSDVNVIAKRPGARLWLKALLPSATRAVCVSRPLGEELQKLGVAEGRIRFVANGVDTALFRSQSRGAARAQLGVPQDAKLVVFVGRLEVAKGIDELLTAIERLRRERPSLRFALLGDGESSARVKLLADASGGHVLAPGARPLPEIASWLAACDVFCLPSHREGTPNVVLEALASGRPVVASDVGGIPDLVDDDVGRLVPVKNAERLARALAEVLDAAWDEERIVRRGPKSWDESALALLSVLEEARAAAAAG